ncbi:MULTISPECIES: hypothetical protein [Mycolicibacter]|uniref:Uncharacterized protein n=2 Tax=Mycolicibacter TaxID=1073531 RepID=A0ABU5XLD8_9MYCO|nr:MULTISPECIES: hypothetical protein [unclassified Mycolicibacter]MEB3023077.1 hypothetical protein [Mycolicibacter sp. MYC098]MEB3033587.1 hypothetical protein [Mycolicibacter sp. MYC340]
MPNPQIRLTPAEALGRMRTLGGEFDSAKAQASTSPGVGIDSRVAAAVQGQVTMSQQLITDASSTSGTAGVAAQALGDQDKKNKDMVGGIGTDLDRKAGQGSPDARRSGKDPTVMAVDYVTGGGLPESPAPTLPIDPDNPFIGDERFGYWTNYTPPPYTGATPPPPTEEHRPLDGAAARPGGPTGFYTPGRTWVTDDTAPYVSVSEGYRFRITGTDGTSFTRTVTTEGGAPQLQQWVAYTYESQKVTSVNLGGDIWAKTGPDQSQGRLGGVMTGGLSGLVIPPHIGAWQGITPQQIATLSYLNPTVTYYIPNGCGGQFPLLNGDSATGPQPPPTIPVMRAPRP